MQVFNESNQNALIAQNLSFHNFLLRLIDEGLAQYNITIRNHLKMRYTLDKHLDIYAFCRTLEANSYFPMTTSLNIQGLSDYRSNYIFISKERTKRATFADKKLRQEDIDRAFAKPPRRTTAHDKIGDYIVIMLETNNTSAFDITEYQGYKISSTSRTFVEIVSNVHYFESSDQALALFHEIKDHLNVDKIYDIIERFDFVYPYFQLVGFYLEQIGFDKEALKRFYARKSALKFYAQKNKEAYLFDEYWGVYY